MVVFRVWVEVMFGVQFEVGYNCGYYFFFRVRALISAKLIETACIYVAVATFKGLYKCRMRVAFSTQNNGGFLKDDRIRGKDLKKHILEEIKTWKSGSLKKRKPKKAKTLNYIIVLTIISTILVNIGADNI